MKRISVLLYTAAYLLLMQAPSVNAHGYMSVPKSRNKLANERPYSEGPNYCPHCLASGGRRTSPLVYPETIKSGRSHGLCGDAPKGNDACWSGGLCTEQDHMPGGKFYKADGPGGAIQAVYSAGQTIDVSMTITAHHKGVVELRLCDEARVTQKCLNKYPALQRVDFEKGALRDAQPINPNHPEMFYINPTSYDPARNTQGNYEMTAKFKLPEGVTCDHCVLQWWWLTANSCVPPGYRDFDFPKAHQGDGKTDFYIPTQEDCVGTTAGEEFWNCADIAITSQKNTDKHTTKPAAASTPATKPVATTTKPAATTTKPAAKPTSPDSALSSEIVRTSCVSFYPCARLRTAFCTGFLAEAAKQLGIQVKDIVSFGVSPGDKSVGGSPSMCTRGDDGSFVTAPNNGLWAGVMYQVCGESAPPCKKRRYLRSSEN
jgi:hypothetical protein